MTADDKKYRDSSFLHKAAYPVIDAHNHLWGNWDVAGLVAVMDEVGVVSYCDLTANIEVQWAKGGYVLHQGDFRNFFDNCDKPYPGRFYAFTTATFATPTEKPLFEDADEFVCKTTKLLREHVSMGARGLKILKELGLHYRDGDGNLIAVDDERLAPIWDEAAKLGVPVLIHQSDPVAFFEPITPENEHYESLKKYTSWSFADSKFPRKTELIARRDNLLKRHPNTTFILPHVANWAEDLEYVSKLLDNNANVMIDFSARIDELGRVPEKSREFCIRWQDRILFGTDMPVSAEMYRCYFRFLETNDDGFYMPDYDGTFDRHRWALKGLALPGDVLEKIYNKNALRIIPGLREDFQQVLKTRE